jgi:hypothetical protein
VTRADCGPSADQRSYVAPVVATGIRYAAIPDRGHVAYQIMGDGPLDLVCLGYGNLISFVDRDDEPHSEHSKSGWRPSVG